jgi:GNAT superfamily N-acetyltransferase
MIVQDAAMDDVRILAAHHRKMFEEIWELKGLEIDIDQAKKLESAYLDKITKQIPKEVCKAWVIKNGDVIIASGAITIISFVPVPSDLSPDVAYLHSIYTEKTHRHKKCAQKIVNRAIEYCRENGINRVFLNASDAGKPVYEKAGFASSPETMRLFIK